MHPTLWDVEDAEAMPAVRNTLIARVSTAEVREFCHRYHYAIGHGSSMLRYGLWFGPVLLGVISYNTPTRDVQECIFGPDHISHVWHMGRLALADVAPYNSESRLIAGSLRKISNDRPDIWAIVTYADTDAGHIGYVYQATNAIYTGAAEARTYYVDQQGHRRATHQSQGYVSLSEARERGWTIHYGGPKHRYVYVLGNRSERRARLRALRLPALPYPKKFDPASAISCETPPRAG